MKTLYQLLKEIEDCKPLYDHMYMIDEELHPDLQAELESPQGKTRLPRFAKKVRTMIKSGQDTGLQDDKPKKGSSRAVFFPKAPHPVHVDGKPVQIPTVVKIAFHGQLDHFNKSGMLLGEHQNLTERDPFSQQHYSILSPTDKPHHYTTNHERGILAPVFDSHVDGHYLHMARIRPLKKGEFRELTKTPEFPKGISHTDMYHTLMHHHEEAHGRHYPFMSPDVDKFTEHPLINKMLDFVQTAGQHPGDYATRNMGVFDHPDGSRHIVVSDYGFSHSVAQEYNNARKNLVREMNNQRINKNIAFHQRHGTPPTIKDR